ncbi:MAG: tRNA (N6-isopentenyl adenosine(37)-C2)-methylthiotransferase MiaB [Firmicutes bacterium]|nr:tRNA (N6-isopentenyl adenosine(37)-C2)-methylthiotransferase MiaB [Bacillota bacterium]
MHLPDLNVAKDRTSKENKYITLNENYQSIFKGQKYFLRTYGCQMNVHDSEAIRSYLETLGYVNTERIEEANIVVLNTCAIRENARDKVVGFLGKCKYLKKNRDDFKIVLAGCMCEQPDFVETIQQNHKYVDLVIGTHNIYELPKLLLELNQKQTIEVYSNSDEIIEGMNFTRDSKVTAWVNIMYGCDKFCTYCIVPYTRGRERSRKLEDILEEVKHLKMDGYKEVTLLGQNVNAYGRDIGESFANLLEQVAKIGIERIRFVTSHPWNFTDEMIDIIAKYDNIMPYIHLPLQSGSNEILKKMNRRYTKEEYLELFNKMKERIPNVAITTDIIVGFPNETEEDFKDTLEVVKACEYDGAYTFIFSPRAGTPAAKMNDEVSLKIKEERLYKLNELVNYYSNKNNQKLLGKVVDVLILGESEKDNTKVYGYTDTMKLVNVVGNKELIGKIVKVKIFEAKSFSLDGECVEELAVS